MAKARCLRKRIFLKLGMLFWIWASWLDYQHQILKDTEHWAFPQPVGKVKLASLNLVMAACDNLLSPWNLELLRGRRRWGSLESGAAQAEVVRILDSNVQPKERAWLWQKPCALHGTRARVAVGLSQPHISLASRHRRKDPWGFLGSPEKAG